MNIAILSRGPDLYSTKRLVEAGEAQGHKMRIIDHTRCSVVVEQGNPTLHYEGAVLNNIDAIIPRIGSSVTFYGASVVRQFEMMGVFSANPSQAIVRSRDKLRTIQVLSKARVGMPKTVFARSGADIKDIIKSVGGTPVVIKLLEGTQGLGVVLAETRKAAQSVIEAFYSLKTNILVQEFISEAEGTDIRAFIVNGRVVGGMRRQAPEGEFRSNLHRGGIGERVELTEQEKTTALTAAKALGLNIAGVDLLPSSRGPLVLEVNSSPGLEGIEGVTGEDIAEEIIYYVASKAGQDNRDKVGV
ncbi:MAG: 30S ribosomal protein S6--L-glutamate ligase [Bacteroidia bacterium]|nr:30S ribosomal protein S6--L-glutamate ligase [Bacteroidia bacterium]